MKSIFKEKSEYSLLKIMSVVSLGIGVYLALRGHDESVATFVYAAFAGKAAQGFISTKKSAE